MSQVTMIITSCGRFDLLERTLDSFLELNTFPLHEIIINEDSGDRKVWHQIIDKYGEIAEVIFQEQKIGLSRSLDVLMNCVETPYVLGWEDDWQSSGNPHFVSQALKVLSERPDIDQVWFRGHTDHKQPIGETYDIGGVPVRDVKYWKDWTGFSFNPRLVRLSDYKTMFPNGYQEFEDEILCNYHVKQFAYKAVTLENSSVKHIGGGRHTNDFKN